MSKSKHAALCRYLACNISVSTDHLSTLFRIPSRDIDKIKDRIRSRREKIVPK